MYRSPEARSIWPSTVLYLIYVDQLSLILLELRCPALMRCLSCDHEQKVSVCIGSLGSIRFHA